MKQENPDFKALKERLKTTWMTGDFGEIAKTIESHAETFLNRLSLKPGMRVLDVACGNGNFAIPAAREGAMVTGIDLAPNLVEQARERAKQEGVDVTFDEGDAEALPYPDGSFDLVVSMYGAMFAPQPDRVVAELKRVCRPGGQIAMANWTPDSFIGQMVKIAGSYVPPPEGMPSPLLWGNEATVRERLQDGISELQLKKVQAPFYYPFSAADTVAFYRTYYGPFQRIFEALTEDKQYALQQALENHWEQHNQATDGTVYLTSEYLEVIATRG